MEKRLILMIAGYCLVFVALLFAAFTWGWVAGATTLCVAAVAGLSTAEYANYRHRRDTKELIEYIRQLDLQDP